MKISELITSLKFILATKGDLHVVVSNYEKLGDYSYLLERDSLVVENNILCIE